MSRKIVATDNKRITRGDVLVANYGTDIFNYIVTDVDDYGITVSKVIDEDWSKGLTQPLFECFHSIEDGFPINADDCKELEHYGKATQFVVFDIKGRKRSSSWDFHSAIDSLLDANDGCIVAIYNGHELFRWDYDSIHDTVLDDIVDFLIYTPSKISLGLVGNDYARSTWGLDAGIWIVDEAIEHFHNDAWHEGLV